MYSIRNHLIAFFVILIFLPFGLISWSFTNSFELNTKEYVEQSTSNILAQSRQQISMLIQTAEQTVEYQNDIIKKQVVNLNWGKDSQVIRELLKANLINKSMLKNIGVVDINKQHFFMSFIDSEESLVSKEIMNINEKTMTRLWHEDSSSNIDTASPWEETTFQIKTRPWYQLALNQTASIDYEAVWTPPYIFEHSGEIGISYAKAVNKSGQGYREAFAIAFVDISLEGISKVLQDLEVGNDSHIALINRNNKILASSLAKDEKILIKTTGLSTITELGKDFLNEDIWQQLKKNNNSKKEIVKEGNLQSYTYQDTDYFARPLYFTEEPLKKFDWTLWVFVPKDTLLTNYYKSRMHVYLLTVISLFFALIISFYIWLKINRPLNSIIAAFNRLQNGDFKTRLVIENSYLEIEELKNHFNKMLTALQENTLMERLISKRARQDIAQNISLHDDGIMLKEGTRIQRTLLFSDIRGFTNYSEHKEPEEIISMLNNYLGIHAEVIDEFGGDVDKYVGDEVMATFDGIDSELKAVHAAVKICQRIQDYKTTHNLSLSVGIGIHNGLVVTGYIGSEGRAQFTSIGSTVNFAARLCSKARSDEIWVSETIYQNCPDTISFKYLGDIEFKGIQKPQQVYIVNYK